MEHVARIPVTYSRLFFRALALNAKSLPKLLQGTGLSVTSFNNDDAFITSEQQLCICQNTVDLAQSPSVGLNVGNQISLSSIGPIGFLVMSSPNLFSALKQFQTHLPRQLGFVQFQSHKSGRYLEYKIILDLEVETPVYRFLIEIFLIVINKIIEFVLGRDFTEGKIGCRYGKPGYLVGTNLHSTVVFDQVENSILIPLELCDAVNVESNQTNYSFALNQLQAMVDTEVEPSEHVRGALKDILLSRPPGTVTEEDAAEVLCISKRTLARRLKQEGTSFRGINEELLSTLAMSYLTETNLNVDSIAALLNYHDGSNFRRAFKRWFKMVPSEFRSLNSR